MKKLNIIRSIRPDEYGVVREAIKNSVFLKKVSWTRELHEMAYDGLSKRKWTGLGAFGDDETLMSYLDYKELPSGEIEVGICMTIEEYMGLGIMKLMLLFLRSRYPDREITIGTYEHNKAMIACIHRVGFYEEFRVNNDRIDGSSSIHYRLKSSACILEK